MTTPPQDRGSLGAAQAASSPYTLTTTLELRGTPDHAAIRARLARVVRWRPALRARHSADGAATVVPAHECPEPEWEHRVLNATGGDADNWEQAQKTARDLLHQPYPRDAMPRLRATLLTVTPVRHLLVVRIDPHSADAWSANLIVNDLLAPDDAPAPADDFLAIIQARQEWLAGPEGRAATELRQRESSGAAARWPIKVSGDNGPPAVLSRSVDVDEEIAAALTQRLRKVRGTVLALGAQALALGSQGLAEENHTPEHAGTPLALRTTLAARDPHETTTVGRFSEDGVLVVPPREGTIAKHLSALRGNVFSLLTSQKVPYRDVAPALDAGAPDGLTLSLLYLPPSLAGGDGTPSGEDNEPTEEFGGCTARREASLICPAGADVDLFMAERPAPLGVGAPPALRVGAMVRSNVMSEEETDRLLWHWVAALHRLANRDWATDPPPMPR